MTWTHPLTTHSRDSVILKLRSSGSNFLGIVGLIIKKALSTNWLIIPSLDPKNVWHTSSSQSLLPSDEQGNVEQWIRRYCHRDLSPEEPGFML